MTEVQPSEVHTEPWKETPKIAMKLSICISYYNALDYLSACLSSIERYPPSGVYEVLVVDDASPRTCVPLVRRQFPNVRLLANNVNRGFAASNNRAIRESRGSYILILNNDTEVFGGSLDALVGYLDENPNVGAVGPKVLNADGSFQLQCKRGMLSPLSGLAYSSGLDRRFPSVRAFGEYLMIDASPDETHEVKALSGACMLVRREAIQDVGMLNERFGMYGEDLDWCYRMGAAGWRICYYPLARIVHHGGKGGSASLSLRNRYLYHRALWLIFSRYPQSRWFPLYAGFVWMMIAARFLASGAANLLRDDKRVGTRKGNPTARGGR
jgi:GT2 family glycosyltransferase